MLLLADVDKPGSDIDEYTTVLDTLLAKRVETATALRNRIAEFRSHIKQEKDLSRKFFEQQQEIKDVFDLTSGNVDDGNAQMLTYNLGLPMPN